MSTTSLADKNKKLKEINFNKLWDQWDHIISYPLKELLNPNKAIGSLGGGVRGVYERLEWENDLVFRLKNTARVLRFHHNSESAADGFFNGILDYVRRNLPLFTEDDQKRVKLYEEKHHTSDSVAYGFIVAETRRILEEKGFYDSLDKVYSTLKIVASIGSGYPGFLGGYLEEGGTQEAAKGLDILIRTEEESIKKNLTEFIKHASWEVDNAAIAKCAADDVLLTLFFTERGIRIVPTEFRESRQVLQAYRALVSHLNESYKDAMQLLGNVSAQELKLALDKYKSTSKR